MGDCQQVTAPSQEGEQALQVNLWCQNLDGRPSFGECLLPARGWGGAEAGNAGPLPRCAKQVTLWSECRWENTYERAAVTPAPGAQLPTPCTNLAQLGLGFSL